MTPSVATAIARKLTLGICTSMSAYAQPADHLELVRQTPCLEQYRLWAFSRTSSDFIVPPGFTAEQCAYAKTIHERIQEEQYHEALKDRERQEREAEAQQQRLRDQAAALKRRAQQEQEARDAVAARPPARLGMSRDQVRNQSNWGPPRHIVETITTAGVRELWDYGDGDYLYFTNGRLTAIRRNR